MKLDKDSIEKLIAIAIACFSICVIFITAIIHDIKTDREQDEAVLAELNCVKEKCDSLQLQCDTLEAINSDLVYDIQNARIIYMNETDSLQDEIDVLKVKLDRIKEYNRIAGQGNNITFLRGWINRVLNQ